MKTKQITKPTVRQLEEDKGTLTADNAETETLSNISLLVFLLVNI